MPHFLINNIILTNRLRIQHDVVIGHQTVLGILPDNAEFRVLILDIDLTKLTITIVAAIDAVQFIHFLQFQRVRPRVEYRDHRASRELIRIQVTEIICFVRGIDDIRHLGGKLLLSFFKGNHADAVTAAVVL